MGAMVAYEMALALKAKLGREPDALIVSGHDAPHHIRPSKRRWYNANDDEFITMLSRIAARRALFLKIKSSCKHCCRCCGQITKY